MRRIDNFKPGPPVPLLTWLIAACLTAAPAAGQFPALPTLEELHISSASGWFQLGFSGRLDLEGYLPQDAPAWIIPDTDPFVAPRLRVFGDAFFGEHFLLSSELRVDRGEEPRADAMEVRLDQLFVRFTPPVPVALQAGKFVSPFGGYPQRHHTSADPLIRPPLPYDYRTILSAARAPGSAADLLTWKDWPEQWRPGGAPVVWGAPYQWGAMLMGDVGPVSARAAVMNSAPSSEPGEWGLERGFGAPSWIASAGMQVAVPLRVELSYNRGPWLREDAMGLPAGADAADYDQAIWGAGAVFHAGGSTVRAEAFHDTWGVPNIGYGVVDVSWYVEAEHDVDRFTGLTLAARYSAIHFGEVGGSGSGYGTDYGARWDYDVSRLQIGAGYRLARNAGIRGEYAFNGSVTTGDLRDNLLSVQLWWEF